MECYETMRDLNSDFRLILGDTNSCLFEIGAKRLHISSSTWEPATDQNQLSSPKRKTRQIVDITSDINLAYS